MKNSSGTIGNRTRDLPACSAVPQLRHRIPPNIFTHTLKYRGQGGTFSQPYLYFSGMDISPSTKTEYYLF
jgi:hypothetical protein